MSESMIEPRGSAFYRVSIDGLRGELRELVESQFRFFIQRGLPEGYIDLRIYYDAETLGEGRRDPETRLTSALLEEPERSRYTFPQGMHGEQGPE